MDLAYRIGFAILALALAYMIGHSAGLRKAAYQDQLTKAPNRRAGQELLARYEERRRKRKRNFGAAIIMVDVDHFKMVNDTHGHDGGDAVLKMVFHLLQHCCRNVDSVFRMGGEEFLIFLPGVSQDEAEQIAERMRKALETTVQYGETVIPITASFGLAVTDRSMTILETVAKADGALYKAKEGGRNQVKVAS